MTAPTKTMEMEHTTGRKLLAERRLGPMLDKAGKVRELAPQSPPVSVRKRAELRVGLPEMGNEKGTDGPQD